MASRYQVYAGSWGRGNVPIDTQPVDAAAAGIGVYHHHVGMPLLLPDEFERLHEMLDSVRLIGGVSAPNADRLALELQHAKEEIDRARAAMDRCDEREREVRAILEADPHESTPAAAKRVASAVPDCGPTDRDRREAQAARERLQRLIIAGGETSTGGRSLYDSAADEIVRLRAKVEEQAKSLAAIGGAEAGLRCGVRIAREHGAAEMRERAAALVRELTSPVMKVRNFGELAERIAALPLSPGGNVVSVEQQREIDAAAKARAARHRAEKAPAVAHEPGRVTGEETATTGSSSVAPAPAATQGLPKPARVEPRQWWRTPGGYEAHVTAGPEHDGTMTLESTSPGVRTFRWPADKMLSSPDWIFLGPAPAPQDPKRDGEAEAIATPCADTECFSCPGDRAWGASAASAAENLSEPTARDAAAGMLLRYGYVDLARDVADGSVTPGEVARRIRTYPAGSAACLAALEALARGDLRGARDHQDLLAAIERLQDSRDAERATVRGAVTRLGAPDHEGLWPAAERVVRERDEARAAAGGGAQELSDLRREHQTDRDDEPADMAARWAQRRDRLTTAIHGDGLTVFARGYLNGCRDTWGSAEVDLLRGSRVAPETAMRIEKRADGSEWLVGANGGDVNDCMAEAPTADRGMCHYHMNGEHIHTGMSVNGAEPIIARWPIEPAQDEPQAKPWNTCPKCEELVDVDDVSDGGEARCRACDAYLIAESFVYDTWRLRDPDDDRETLHDEATDVRLIIKPDAHSSEVMAICAKLLDVDRIVNADGSIAIEMHKDADPRAVLATVAELLGLDAGPDVGSAEVQRMMREGTPEEIETHAMRTVTYNAHGAAWLRGYASGIREGERRRREYGLAAIRTLAELQERETAWSHVTGASNPEDVRRAFLATGRTMIERAHAEGIEEGERRAKVKAEELVTKWWRKRGAADGMRRACADDPAGTREWRERILTIDMCEMDVRKAFDLGIPDGQPPTGGEPGPEDDGFPADVPPEVEEQIQEISSKAGERVADVMAHRRDRITADLGRVIRAGISENLLPHEIAHRAVRWLEHVYGFNTSALPTPTDADERWDTGAVWEKKTRGNLEQYEIEYTSIDLGSGAAFAHFGDYEEPGRDPVDGVPVAEMTEANGWRYIGRPASEAPTAETIVGPLRHEQGKWRIEIADAVDWIPLEPQDSESDAIDLRRDAVRLIGRLIGQYTAPSDIERAHANGVVEGLKRARRIVSAHCKDPLRREVDEEIATWIEKATAAAPADRQPPADRAALLALAEGWEREAKRDRRRADTEQPMSPEFERGEAMGLEHAARDLRRLLDAPRGPGGGERNPGASSSPTSDVGGAAAPRGGVDRARAALQSEASEFEASRDPALRAEGRALRRAARLIASDRDARLVLATIGFVDGAIDRVLGTSTAERFAANRSGNGSHLEPAQPREMTGVVSRLHAKLQVLGGLLDEAWRGHEPAKAISRAERLNREALALLDALTASAGELDEALEADIAAELVARRAPAEQAWHAAGAVRRRHTERLELAARATAAEVARAPDYRDGLAEGQRQGRERAQELAERWRSRASNKAAPPPVAGALDLVVFELCEAFGLDPEGPDHEPDGRERVDGTSADAAQDGSSASQDVERPASPPIGALTGIIGAWENRGNAFAAEDSAFGRGRGQGLLDAAAHLKRLLDGLPPVWTATSAPGPETQDGSRVDHPAADPAKAETIPPSAPPVDVAELRHAILELRAKVAKFDGGDRAPSPPARLLRELHEAEEALRAARAKAPSAPEPCATCDGSGEVNHMNYEGPHDCPDCDEPRSVPRDKPQNVWTGQWWAHRGADGKLGVEMCVDDPAEVDDDLIGDPRWVYLGDGPKPRSPTPHEVGVEPEDAEAAIAAEERAAESVSLTPAERRALIAAGYVEGADGTWCHAWAGAPIDPRSPEGLRALRAIAADKTADDRTPEEREAGVAKMRAWLRDLPPELAKVYADARAIDPKGQLRDGRPGLCRNGACPELDGGIVTQPGPCSRCGVVREPIGHIAAAEDAHVGVDLGAGPATFAAQVLERQPGGELRPLATFEGADAEQRARDFIATLPEEPATPNAGPRIELRDGAEVTVDTLGVYGCEAHGSAEGGPWARGGT